MSNNNFGLSDEQIENMLEKVSSQMGIDKEALRANLQNGNMNQLVEKQGDNQKTKVLKMMQDKNLMDKFLQSKQAMDYMKKLSKEL